jgi:hypothetical protein
VPLTKGTVEHCEVPLQLLVEHGVSAHVMLFPTQLPRLQWSPQVQILPSSQASPSFGAESQYQKPYARSHVSEPHAPQFGLTAV